MRLYKSLYLFPLIFFSLCRSSEESVIRDLQGKFPDISTGLYGNKPLYLVHSGCDHSDKSLLVFVHGSPGRWNDYQKYLEEPNLRNKYCMVSFDRAGYGSSLSENSIPNLDTQADLLTNALADFKDKHGLRNNRIIFVGHSYGGPIITRIAKNSEGSGNNFILIASPMDPSLEEVRWYNHFAEFFMVKWLLPKEIIHSNEEMLPLREQLTSLVNNWKPKLNQMIVIHGDNDFLVPFENVKFMKSMFGSNLIQSIELKDENHFIPWTKFDLVVKVILEVEV